ncbi:MAG: restriction endonuclease subunit S [Muribaculaceae bacterium]|nr:restriction endonuclease subunit S [Muribaculaceae bacterium]
MGAGTKYTTASFGSLIIEQPKSTTKVSEATGFGNYPFFTSGEAVLQHLSPLTNGESIYMATGGQANVKYFDGEAAYSTDTWVVKAKEPIDSKLLYYHILSLLSKIDYQFFQGSGLKHLQKKDFKRHEITFPTDPKEQERIVVILSDIDKAIAETEALIAKYELVKKGLMHDLLTNGIDENGNIRSPQTHVYKDSPLGPIPQEWTLIKLDNLITHIADCPHSTPNYLDSGVLVARTSSIKNGEYLIAESSYVSEEEYQSRIARLQPLPGDVIFTREAPIGEAFVIPEHMRICLGQRVTVIRTKKDLLNPYFFVYCNYSSYMKSYYENIVGGTTVAHLNVKDIKKLSIKLPTIKEQNQIVGIMFGIDTYLFDLKSELNKLNSFKTGLLHDLLNHDKEQR